MPPVRQEFIYSLLTIVLVLLLGIVGLLWVNNNRHQRLSDQTVELRRNLDEQTDQISTLRDQLARCDSLETLIRTDTTSGTPVSADGW